jgi:hypothetical protein
MSPGTRLSAYQGRLRLSFSEGRAQRPGRKGLRTRAAGSMIQASDEARREPQVSRRAGALNHAESTSKWRGGDGSRRSDRIDLRVQYFRCPRKPVVIARGQPALRFPGRDTEYLLSKRSVASTRLTVSRLADSCSVARGPIRTLRAGQAASRRNLIVRRLRASASDCRSERWLYRLCNAVSSCRQTGRVLLAFGTG